MPGWPRSTRPASPRGEASLVEASLGCTCEAGLATQKWGWLASAASLDAHFAWGFAGSHWDFTALVGVLVRVDSVRVGALD
eukprot:4636268-Prymnesium_polylepis.1